VDGGGVTSAGRQGDGRAAPGFPGQAVAAGKSWLYSVRFDRGGGGGTTSGNQGPDARRAYRSTGKGSSRIFRQVVLQEEPAMQLTEKHQEYWSKNLAMTAILLGIWFVVTFVMGYYARDLSFNFFGWPFAFYMAAQGSLIIYVIIIWYYARYMNNLDREYDVHEGEED
jgi:putative solute:sodium symporter small subunit